MFRELLFLSAESPVHAGADSGLGVIDLPIQREVTSRFPLIWGQSLKGALRETCRRAWSNDALVRDIFGGEPPGSGSPDTAPTGQPKPGSLNVGDARLVAFPTPTLVDSYAYLTSALALSRLSRKIGLMAGVTGPPKVPRVRGDACRAASTKWSGETTVGPYVVRAVEDPDVATWSAWLAANALPAAESFKFFQEKVSADLLLVGDDVLGAVSVECAELSPRVQLNKVKTVTQGPFYAEYLPTESLLVAMLESSSQEHLKRLRKELDGQVVQLGGDETIGKGLMWCRFVSGVGDIR